MVTSLSPCREVLRIGSFLIHPQAYSLHDREVGYCQGSGFIVGLLLMQVIKNNIKLVRLVKPVISYFSWMSREIRRLCMFNASGTELVCQASFTMYIFCMGDRVGCHFILQSSIIWLSENYYYTSFLIQR